MVKVSPRRELTGQWQFMESPAGLVAVGPERAVLQVGLNGELSPAEWRVPEPVPMGRRLGIVADGSFVWSDESGVSRCSLAGDIVWNRSDLTNFLPASAGNRDSSCLFAVARGGLCVLRDLSEEDLSVTWLDWRSGETTAEAVIDGGTSGDVDPAPRPNTVWVGVVTTSAEWSSYVVHADGCGALEVTRFLPEGWLPLGWDSTGERVVSVEAESSPGRVGVWSSGNFTAIRDDLFPGEEYSFIGYSGFFCPGDELLVVEDAYSSRYYRLDATTLETVDEVAVAGYDPAPPAKYIAQMDRFADLVVVSVEPGGRRGKSLTLVCDAADLAS
ncbi:MAG: hypothetical protein FWH11_02065 [Micrococcales bacterium]|nr:hypothetical protein [Micrococcales bacterium]